MAAGEAEKAESEKQMKNETQTDIASCYYDTMESEEKERAWRQAQYKE